MHWADGRISPSCGWPWGRSGWTWGANCQRFGGVVGRINSMSEEQSGTGPTAMGSEVEIPEELSVNDLHERGLKDLYQLGLRLGLRVGGMSSKHDLVSAIMTWYGRRGVRIRSEGILDLAKEGFGMVRYPAYSFRPGPDDVHVAANLTKNLHLRKGQRVGGYLRMPQDRDKHPSMGEITEIEGWPAAEWQEPPIFDDLTALSPRERLILEGKSESNTACRIVDIVAPLGKGQRGLIVASPRSGKTILLKQIARALQENHPEAELMVLLIDERPEEVTDFEEFINGHVVASTFDEAPRRHVQVAEIVLERARRLVEMGRDVIILLDSITRLARGYNQMMGGRGALMSGGINKQALEPPRRFFGAARNVEEGGSLTILATALVDTENRMDTVIFEEFKGTGNMEIHLDRELAEKRIYPAIHPQLSGTRKDDYLYHPDEFQRISVLRRQLAQLPAGEAMEALIHSVENTKSNAELLLRGLKV